MNMGAGDLNRKIMVSKPTGDVDGANQPLDTWVPAFPNGLWAKILGTNGMTAIRNSAPGVQAMPIKYSFRIRYRPAGITEAMRVEYAGLVFDIEDIVHDFDRHEYTDLICQTGGNNG